MLYAEISVDDLMEKKKSSSSNKVHYESPLGYTIEDVRPNGGVHKFHSAVYSNVRTIKFI